MGNTVFGEAWNNVLWTMGLILLLISMLFVSIVRRLNRPTAHDQLDAPAPPAQPIVAAQSARRPHWRRPSCGR